MLEGGGLELRTAASPPTVILVVGVNGTGKTTTIAKLAYRFKTLGAKVLLAAADTFRAADFQARHLQLALDTGEPSRVARAVAMDIAVMEYVEAARLRGEKIWWLMRQEILPNAMPPLVAEFGLRFCFVFLLSKIKSSTAL